MVRAKVLCNCAECRNETSYDATRDTEVQGRWLSPSQHLHHSKVTEEALSLVSTGQGSARASNIQGAKLRREVADSRDVPTTASVVDLQQLTETLAVHAHVEWGLSHTQASTLLRASQHLLRLALAPELGSQLRLNPVHDIRTAIKHADVEPVIMRSVCCPKCFKAHALPPPEFCDWKECSRCRPCGEPLTAVRWTSRQGAIIVPRRLYSVQCFDDWLKWFLNRPGIEAMLEHSWSHTPSPNRMRSTWDSPAWNDAEGFSATQGNLTFSLFYDGFNPFHNKIAGKVVSCGVLSMRCLNLPYEISRMPVNTFFFALTPLPFAPDVVTISAIVSPLVDQLIPYNDGRTIRTHACPLGRFIRVRVKPTIHDILAGKKLNGFGSHSCEQFCSDCLCTLDGVERLDMEAWILRDAAAVRAAAAAWDAAESVKRRDELFKLNGVRGSPLHGLAYRDCVRHNVLGVMHNWFEGVLQHHWRVKFAVGGAWKGEDITDNHPPAQAALQADPMEIDESPELQLRRERNEIELEALKLQLDRDNYAEGPLGATRFRLVNQNPGVPTFGSSGSSDKDYLPSNQPSTDREDVEMESDDENGLDMSEEDLTAAWCPPGRRIHQKPTFDSSEIAFIHARLAEIIYPSYFQPPPSNIGEKRHGKLTAIQWRNLYTPSLAMVLLELWFGNPSPRSKLLLQNFESLVAATRRIVLFETSPVTADEYTTHYIAYRKSCRELWPTSASVPNHHYAMHNGAQLKFWGPLVLLSEFPFEADIGDLQDISTNNHYGQSNSMPRISPF